MNELSATDEVGGKTLLLVQQEHHSNDLWQIAGRKERKERRKERKEGGWEGEERIGEREGTERQIMFVSGSIRRKNFN